MITREQAAELDRLHRRVVDAAMATRRAGRSLNAMQYQYRDQMHREAQRAYNDYVVSLIDFGGHHGKTST